MEKVFKNAVLDTNVWLDYFLPTRKRHRQSKEFLIKANAQDVTFLYPVVATKDIFYLLSSSFKHSFRKEDGSQIDQGDANAVNELAWGCINCMKEIASPIGCDVSDVWYAEKIKLLHTDYEDNLIIASALRADADVLITNDKKLLLHSPVAALSVDDALKCLM